MSFLNGIVNLFRFDKTNWKAVALCAVAATVFWIFNALNKEHTATISYPLQFKYDEVKFIPVKNLPTKVALNITGSGWDLLRKSLGFKINPLLIELEKPADTRKIPPATVLPLAAIQLGQTKVNHVTSDTLLISIEPRVKKKIKLSINSKQIRFELGYGAAGEISIAPDYAEVEGPLSLIKSLADSIVLPFPPGRISQDVKIDLSTKDVVDGVTFDPPVVQVQFDVDELKDVEKLIKVVVIPSPPYRFQILHDSLMVTIRIPEKLKSSVENNNNLVGAIDLRDINPGVNKVIPSLKGLTSFGRVVKIDSVIVRKY